MTSAASCFDNAAIHIKLFIRGTPARTVRTVQHDTCNSKRQLTLVSGRFIEVGMSGALIMINRLREILEKNRNISTNMNVNANTNTNKS